MLQRRIIIALATVGLLATFFMISPARPAQAHTLDDWQPNCWGYVNQPQGAYTPGSALYASVYVEVDCNFYTTIDMTAIFHAQTGSNYSTTEEQVTLPYSATGNLYAYYSYTPSCGEEGTYDHWGELSFYWDDPNGFPIYEELQGPHNMGQYWNFTC
jgi:hypothetical protein